MRHKVIGFLLLVGLVGLGLIAFADNPDPLTINVTVESGETLKEVQIFSISNTDSQIGNKTERDVVNGDKLIYDLRDSNTNNTQIRLPGKNSCQSLDGSVEIPVSENVVNVTFPISGLCTFSIAVVEPLKLTMNFYVHGLPAEEQAQFHVAQYNTKGLIPDAGQNYDFGNTWPTIKEQTMELDYEYAVIEFAGDTCKFVGTSNDEIGKEITTVHVTTSGLPDDTSCVLSNEPPVQPEPIINLEMIVTSSGLDESNQAKLQVLELKSASRGAGYKETKYDIFKAYSTFEQIMDNEYPDHSEMDVSIHGVTYLCKFENGTVNIAKSLEKIYVDIDNEVAPPICLLALQPTHYSTIDVNISELESDPIYLYEDPELRYTIYSDTAVIGQGVFKYKDAAVCSNGMAPSAGLCVETIEWASETDPTSITLTWYRFKSTNPLQNSAPCKYHDSVYIPYTEIGELEIYGLDPQNTPITCQLR